jgi:regulator of cell morphogenesis and NO signaling
MNLVDQPMAQIAREIPGATSVLYKFGLDFCCGGSKALREGLTEKGLKIEPVLQELEALLGRDGDGTRWVEVSDKELIEHILSRYHDAHRDQLPELIRLARRVEQVHGDRPECPVTLWSHLEQLLTDLENHMRKEEEILFPMISRGMGPMASGPIFMMQHEHDSHGQALGRIEKLTNNLTLPKASCNSWRALYLGLETFKADLMNHIHLENNILFERIVGKMATANQ